MHYILIDDNQEALAFLALQMGKAFPGELALTRLTLIWPNNIPIESTLRNAASSLVTGSTDFRLHTPQTLKQLIAFIAEVAKDQEPAVLVSDLNMKNIGLTADGEDGWFDRPNPY
jgi:hypothetical protein